LDAITWGLLPTPTVLNDSFYVDKTPNRHTKGIATIIFEAGLLPTPKQGGIDDCNERAIKKKQLSAIVGKETGLKLQPSFVEWMMGYPIDYTKIEIELTG
jgi:hypothetical protein